LIPFEITPARFAAFQNLKSAVFALEYLKHYDASRETCIKTDVLDNVILKVLS